MSEPLRVALVVEGPTDYVVISAAIAAMLAGRDFVTPDDVKEMFVPVCAHRVLSKSYLHNGDAHGTEAILRMILNQVAVPQ